MPDQKCVELKSLKLFINSYRDVGIFHEDVANLLVDKLVALLNPKELQVIADFSRRGNIHTVVTVNYIRGSGKVASVNSAGRNI